MVLFYEGCQRRPSPLQLLVRARSIRASWDCHTRSDEKKKKPCSWMDALVEYDCRKGDGSTQSVKQPLKELQPNVSLALLVHARSVFLAAGSSLLEVYNLGKSINAGKDKDRKCLGKQIAGLFREDKVKKFGKVKAREKAILENLAKLEMIWVEKDTGGDPFDRSTGKVCGTLDDVLKPLRPFFPLWDRKGKSKKKI